MPRRFCITHPPIITFCSNCGCPVPPLHTLGITGELRKSLACTNLIESLFAVGREKTQRVKNWKARRSNQILRWVASSILAHRQKMRRVRGMAQAKQLIAALGLKQLAAQAA
jgi:putative transposase